jgi:rhodanese-related sulfurtransferase
VRFRKSKSDRLSPEDLHSRRDELHIVDVRETHEWVAGHIDGSHHVPMGELLRNAAAAAAPSPPSSSTPAGSR